MKEISFKNDILPLGDTIFRLALRITCNRQEAEDVVQDTLMRLWEGRDRLHEVNNLSTYALTICRNLALDHKERFENRNISLDESVHDRQDDDRTPDEQLISRQNHEQIGRLIEQLPEKQRTVIQLRDIEGKSYQEITDITGMTLADVKVSLFRARQALKQECLKTNK